MDNSRHDIEESNPSLEKMYFLLGATHNNDARWHHIRRSLLRGVIVSACIFILINAIILLPNERYLTIWHSTPPFLRVSWLESAIILAGLVSVAILSVI